MTLKYQVKNIRNKIQTQTFLNNLISNKKGSSKQLWGGEGSLVIKQKYSKIKTFLMSASKISNNHKICQDLTNQNLIHKRQLKRKWYKVGKYQSLVLNLIHLKIKTSLRKVYNSWGNPKNHKSPKNHMSQILLGKNK